MESLKLYRKRIIPQECKFLQDDKIVRRDDEMIVTTWDTLNPKMEFSHGCSIYYLKQGIKVSKFYRHDNSLLYWYCDIVDYDFDEANETLTVTDLLADVIIFPDGHMKVVDLDEMADALDEGLITPAMLSEALRRLNELLTVIYRDKFEKLQSPLEQLGL
ncbi:MAG: DUF402 domain-containing protein [Lachnospiraceae bacterium]|nr:DUF402 domain-containing protein [Lachnospiraceae bacterium]